MEWNKMDMKELINEYENLKEQLKRANYMIKVYAKTKHKKTYVIQRNKIQKRLNEIYQYILSYEDKALIDNSPFSVRSHAKRTKGKPRYIMINGKTQNDMNFALVCARALLLRGEWQKRNTDFKH